MQIGQWKVWNTLKKITINNPHYSVIHFAPEPSSPCSSFKRNGSVCCHFSFSFTMRITKSPVPLVAHPPGGEKLWHSKQNRISSIFLQCQIAAGPKCVLRCEKKAADPIICMPHHTYDTRRSKANLHRIKRSDELYSYTSNWLTKWILQFKSCQRD